MSTEEQSEDFQHNRVFISPPFAKNAVYFEIESLRES